MRAGQRALNSNFLRVRLCQAFLRKSYPARATLRIARPEYSCNLCV